MNKKSFKVDVINQMDATREAWTTSKPTISYSSEEELQETVNKMIEQDLPLSAFKQYHLRIESSILFRDLLFTVRPCIAWSSSFRINPITPDRIFFEEMDSWTADDNQRVEQGMQKPYAEFAVGKPLDSVKLGLYLGTMTQYVISIDSRTLMCFIATLYDLDKEGFKYHITELCKVLGYDSYEKLPKGAVNSLYEKLAVHDLTDYSLLTPKKDYPISSYTDFSEAIGMEIPPTCMLQAVVNASTGGQFLRQHFSIMRCQLFDYVKEYGYKNVCLLKCSNRFRYVSVGQRENFTQLIRRRICWVVNWDVTFDNNGVESWGDILEPFIQSMTTNEFASLLPCKCNWKKCTVSEETRLRLWKNKGIDGVVPDENPVCPILLGDPAQVEKRIEFYGSTSSIAEMWKKLVDEEYLKLKTTKWTLENEK
jgi:hypothetical protein